MGKKLFTMKEVAIDLKKISLVSVLYIIPLAIILFLTFKIFWPDNLKAIDLYYESYKPITSVIKLLNLLFPFFVLFLGVIVHEFIHILFFVLFNKKGWVAVKVGFNLKTFTPYAHCSEPIKLKHYILTTAAPGIILGFIPFCISLITGNAWLWGFSMVLSIGAIGDFIIIAKSFRIDLDKYVIDHTYKAGFVVVDNNSENV
jgi:hypothetical protein